MADSSAADPARYERQESEGSRRLGAFLALTRFEVEHEANRLRARSAAGATWDSLSKLMTRRGYIVVGDLGIEAATAWATHLGVVPGGTRAPTPGARGEETSS
jgi:hypothetical protein